MPTFTWNVHCPRHHRHTGDIKQCFNTLTHNTLRIIDMNEGFFQPHTPYCYCDYSKAELSFKPFTFRLGWLTVHKKVLSNCLKLN